MVQPDFSRQATVIIPPLPERFVKEIVISFAHPRPLVFWGGREENEGELPPHFSCFGEGRGMRAFYSYRSLPQWLPSAQLKVGPSSNQLTI
jgi:hypothetical protein